MELNVEEMDGGITRAALAGRMDIEGALSVDARFGALVSLRRRLIVDLSEVTFVASMGLRTLMVCARAVTANGGKIALARPQPGVEKVLAESGIGELIGVHSSLADAVAAVSA